MSRRSGRVRCCEACGADRTQAKLPVRRRKVGPLLCEDCGSPEELERAARVAARRREITIAQFDPAWRRPAAPQPAPLLDLMLGRSR